MCMYVFIGIDLTVTPMCSGRNSGFNHKLLFKLIEWSFYRPNMDIKDASGWFGKLFTIFRWSKSGATYTSTCGRVQGQFQVKPIFTTLSDRTRNTRGIPVPHLRDWWGITSTTSLPVSSGSSSPSLCLVYQFLRFVMFSCDMYFSRLILILLITAHSSRWVLSKMGVLIKPDLGQLCTLLKPSLL